MGAAIESVLALARAVQAPISQDEGLVHQSPRACVAGKAVWACVPMVGVVRDTGVIGRDWTLARAAHLAIEFLEAHHAVGVVILGNVALSRQGRVAAPAAEVMHVPRSPLRLRVLTRKNQLVTGG